MASEPTQLERETRIRNTALRHAEDIEGRKRLQNRIADLVVEAFDLPSLAGADPARPQPSDATLFKRCLALFQPSDLDDLIYERNVDARCGYALCPRPKVRLAGAGAKVWNQKGGREFKLVDREELERFCSRKCRERTAFVRAQLRSEPAWLRDGAAADVRLLDEMESSESLVDSLRNLSMSTGVDQEMAEKLEALALERGEPENANTGDPVPIVEKESDVLPDPPSLDRKQDGVEGHQPRKVRFQNP